MTVFRIHYSNHGYFAEVGHPTLEAAIAAGKAKCFEFTVHEQHPGQEPGFPLVAWSPISGLRRLTR